MSIQPTEHGGGDIHSGAALALTHLEVSTGPAGALEQPTLRAGDIVLGANPRRGDRKKKNPTKWAEFCATIKSRGVLEPVLVRYIADTGQYQLVAGYGRLAGVLEVFGADYMIPIRLVHGDDNDALAMALIENTHREDMTPVEEAEAASELLADFSGDRAEVGRRLGLSPETLDRRLALMNCSSAVRDALVDGRIKLGHAELLAAAPKQQQDDVLAKLLAMPSLIAVAALKAELQRVALPLATACFDKKQCASCQHNSDLQTQMFAEAITAGNCTNRVCYEEKTTKEIDDRVERLKDDFPRVQVVRPGDNHSIIKIVAEGSGGVGAEQAQACRSCKDFGAAVSAVPGKEGNLYKDYCFNPACNARMVAKQIKSNEPTQAPVDQGKGKADPKGKTKAAAKTGASKTGCMAKPSGVTGQVHEFRAKLWREALIAEMAAQPVASFQLLISMALTNNASKVSTDQVGKMFTRVTGTKGDFSFDQVEAALASVKPLSNEVLTQLLVQLSTTGVKQLSDKAVCAALKSFEVDLSKHFTITEDFLKLLTKSELEVVAKQVGLDKAIGEGFAKLSAKKKDEMIKDLLGVQGFNYAVAPQVLQPSV